MDPRDGASTNPLLAAVDTRVAAGMARTASELEEARKPGPEDMTVDSDVGVQAQSA
jgi:hypothetical protein